MRVRVVYYIFYLVGTHKPRFVQSVPRKLVYGWKTTQECFWTTVIWSILAGLCMIGY